MEELLGLPEHPVPGSEPHSVPVQLGIHGHRLGIPEPLGPSTGMDSAEWVSPHHRMKERNYPPAPARKLQGHPATRPC